MLPSSPRFGLLRLVDELFGQPERGGPQNLIDFGAAYKPSLHQQLDFHCGFGLSAALPDHVIGVGYSVRFQVIRAK
jgi:hypothetical protein